MLEETVIAATLTYILMIAAYKYSHIRKFHIPSMTAIILFDLCMPFYLYFTQDWKERLIDGGEIFSFLIWMHVGLVITLYVLYALQVSAGRKILQGNDPSIRDEHKNQGKGILLTRALVIATGALLVEPETLL